MIDFELRGENLKFYQYLGREAVLSGPAETGKTLTALLKIHTLLCKYEGAQIAIIRKVFRDLKSTALLTYRRDIMRVDSFKSPHPYIQVYGGENPQWFDYKPTRSRLWCGGLDNPGKTLSGERDVILVIQAEQLTQADWEYLLRSTTGRGSTMPYTQLLGDCNPGNKTHWILKRANAGRLRLFRSTHKDNPTLWDGGQWTAQGERTLDTLRSFTGARYKRLYQGLWAAPEGMIYHMFNEERHVIEGFVPPPTWPRVVGVDPFGDNIAAVWVALDPHNGVWHVYREHSEPFGLTTQEHAAKILNLSRGESVFYWCGGGPSERQQRLDMASYGIPLSKPATGSVWTQIGEVQARLKSGELVIHDRCTGLISEIGEYRRKTKGGDIQEGTIADKDKYHLLDALRYAVIGPEVGERQRIGTMRRRIEI